MVFVIERRLGLKLECKYRENKKELCGGYYYFMWELIIDLGN